ncbi:MAG: peptidoglycan-N-acetylglucosamine deacetylase [Tepidanaerobacteraceae bacterium]|nr:peptidoglycan-N-acetylglucosamine deacetylase [Tepidanaerobacteraceae bacterium]MDK2878287.1 peptidoglycan-N-acetylglucosamine deacetylase [Thermoanaerobacteraceae bacterium]
MSKKPFRLLLYLKKNSRCINERLLNKCRLTRNEEGAHKREEKKDTKLINALYILMTLTVLIFPIIYFIRHFDIVFDMPVIEQIKIYIVDFNYYLAFYAIAVQSGLYNFIDFFAYPCESAIETVENKKYVTTF